MTLGLLMISNRVVGVGFIVIGLSVLSVGLLEVGSGQFSPVGYNVRSAWLKPFLTVFFGTFGPYVSALIWFAVSFFSIQFGVQMIRKPPPEDRDS